MTVITYFIYYMPYVQKGMRKLYCGYTRDPARREADHRRETRYKWDGELRVVEFFDTNDTQTTSEALAREQYHKNVKTGKKWAWYEKGLPASIYKDYHPKPIVEAV